MAERRKIRTWWVVHVNCGCASYDWARMRAPIGSGQFMRCCFCKRQLGDMEWEFVGKVRSTSESDAIRAAKEDEMPRAP